MTKKIVMEFEDDCDFYETDVPKCPYCGEEITGDDWQCDAPWEDGAYGSLSCTECYKDFEVQASVTKVSWTTTYPKEGKNE